MLLIINHFVELLKDYHNRQTKYYILFYCFAACTTIPRFFVSDDLRVRQHTATLIMWFAVGVDRLQAQVGSICLRRTKGSTVAVRCHLETGHSSVQQVGVGLCAATCCRLCAMRSISNSINHLAT